MLTPTLSIVEYAHMHTPTISAHPSEFTAFFLFHQKTFKYFEYTAIPEKTNEK
jgi:hypothetical protein